MYSKQQASELKQAFWTAFGQYMSPVLSADGEKINWVNYHTGIKHLHFRMDADKRRAVMAIELSHKDAGIQQLYFEQLELSKNILHETLGEQWNWQALVPDDQGKLVSRVSTALEGVNVFKKEDWPALISFFKPRLIALDEFWSMAKYGFEELM